MDYLQLLIVAFASVAMSKLFIRAIMIKPAADLALDYSNGNNCRGDRFDFARAHHLIMERANIDRMGHDMNQYQTNEAWKARLLAYQADCMKSANAQPGDDNDDIEAQNQHDASNSNVVQISRFNAKSVKSNCEKQDS